MSDVETNPDKLYDAATKIRESGDLAGAVELDPGRRGSALRWSRHPPRALANGAGDAADEAVRSVDLHREGLARSREHPGSGGLVVGGDHERLHCGRPGVVRPKASRALSGRTVVKEVEGIVRFLLKT